MAKAKNAAVLHVEIVKKTCQDTRNPKTSSMNKSKRRSTKRYRGQGRP
jgi:hypothetical protein